MLASGIEGPMENQIDPSAAEMIEPGNAVGTMSSAIGSEADGINTSLRQIGATRQKLQSIELDKA